jgi:hypothetical protein
VTSGQLSYPSSSLTSTLYNSKGTIDVKRTSEASPSVTGEIDIEFNGKMKTGIIYTMKMPNFINVKKFILHSFLFSILEETSLRSKRLKHNI